MSFSAHLAAIAALGLSASAAAQAPARADARAQLESLLSCRALSDESERLSCFERAANALETGIEAGEIALIDRGDIEAIEDEAFGRDQIDVASLDALFSGSGARPAPAEPAPAPQAGDAAETSRAEQASRERPTARAAVEETRRIREGLEQVPVVRYWTSAEGRLWLELANGQTWQQIDSTRVRIDDDEREGLTASVRRALFGSYFMDISAHGRSFRARRVE